MVYAPPKLGILGLAVLVLGCGDDGSSENTGTTGSESAGSVGGIAQTGDDTGNGLAIDLGTVPCVLFGVHELSEFIVGDDTLGITCEITAGAGAGRLPNGLSISNACEFEGAINEERLGGWATIVRVLQEGNEVFVPFCAVQSDSELGYDVVVEPSPLAAVAFTANAPVSLDGAMPTFEISGGPDACTTDSCQFLFNFNASASSFDADSNQVLDATLLNDDAGNPIGVTHGFAAMGPAVESQFASRPWVHSVEIDYCLTSTPQGCEAPAPTDDAFAAFAAIMIPAG